MNGIQKLVFMGVILGSAAVTIIGLLLTMPQPADAAGAAPEMQTQAIGEINESQPIAEISNQPAEECEIGSFPVSINQWCESIRAQAEEHGMDPVLVAAVILQESGGDPQAYSSSGAVGLMQVMPHDGIAAGFMCVNGPCFASRPSTSELFHPEFNIAYGTDFLVGLVAKHGDLRQALFAYGPMGVGYSYADKVLAIAERYR